MRKGGFAAAVVLGFLVVGLGPVAAQAPSNPLITPVSDWRDLRSEPDTPVGGHIDSPWYHDGTDYPADDNNIQVAKQGVPAVVLDTQVMSTCGVHMGCTLPTLLEPFAGKTHLLTYYHRWRVLFGTWADANGDGFVQSSALEGATLAGLLQDPTRAASERVYLNPLAASAEEDGNEWSGIGGAHILAYYEPGNWSYASTAREPDFTFFDQAEGYYVAPESAIGFPVSRDHGILRTSVFETISRPVAVADGARNYERNLQDPASLVDVDLYRAVDPLLESLYLTVWDDIYLRTVSGASDPAREAVQQGPNGLRQYYGPAYALVVPPVENENGQRDDYEDGFHTWFDAWLGMPRWHYGAIVTSNRFHDSRESRIGVGAYHPTGYASVAARFGLWHDKNGDGWIGEPVLYPGCPDAYGCGSVHEPNQYDVANEELIRMCVTKDGGFPTIPVHLTPQNDGASWGAGVYILHDADPATQNRNPYDDVVLDLVDGEVDRLVLTGTLTVHLQCDRTRENDGRHVSDELLVFPGGMVGFDLEMRTEAVYVKFLLHGIEEEERVQDTDVVFGWAA